MFAIKDFWPGYREKVSYIIDSNIIYIFVIDKILGFVVVYREHRHAVNPRHNRDPFELEEL